MIQNELLVYEINNEEEKEILREHLNRWAAEAYEKMFNECISLCANEDQKTIFTDWWNSQYVSLDEYKKRFSDKDNYDAGSIILHAVSMGFG
jgi:hypothetical protein